MQDGVPPHFICFVTDVLNEIFPCPRLLIQYIRSYPPCGCRPSIRNLRMSHAVVTGTQFSRVRNVLDQN